MNESATARRVAPDGADRVGRRVLRARGKAGLTQGELARMAGISRPHLSSIENGHAMPSLKLAVRLAQVFGISPSKILFDNPRGHRRGEG